MYAGLSATSAFVPHDDREQQARCGSKQSQQQILGEKLCDYAGTAGSERSSHRYFLLSVGCTRQQHVGNIRAGNQEHERHR